VVFIGKTIGIATVEWNASPLNDIVADSIVALLMHTQSSPASIRASSLPCGHSQRRRRKQGDSLPVNQSGELDTLGGKDSINADDGTMDTEETRLKKKRSSLLRLCYQALVESYAHVDAVFDVSMATFEISLDRQASADAEVESNSTCTVTITFEDESSLDAKISVEYVDAKIAAAIQDCLRSVSLAAAPISLPHTKLGKITK